MTNAAAPTTWPMTGMFLGDPIHLEATVDHYGAGGRLALLLYGKDEDGNDSLFSDLTVNAPHILLMNEERQVIINPDVSRDVLALAIQSGLIEEDWDMVIKLGMSVTHVHSLTDKGVEWALGNVDQS